MTTEPTSDTPIPTPRHDGFTPARQVDFLETLAATGMVRHAAKAAGISHEAAYNLRHRAEGAAFRVGWDAALLMARARLADTLMERAIEGQEEMLLHDADGGSRSRHRHDNRLALSLLGRLDRLAAASAPRGDGHAAAGAVDPAVHAMYGWARIVAHAWDGFIALVEAGGDTAAFEAFLEDHRPAPKTAPEPCQLRTSEGIDPATLTEIEETFDVWKCDTSGDFRTNFPPPDGFDGEELGPRGTEVGDWEHYERALTPREVAFEEAVAKIEADAVNRVIARFRRDWFRIVDGQDEIGTEGMTITLVDAD